MSIHSLQQPNESLRVVQHNVLCYATRVDELKSAYLSLNPDILCLNSIGKGELPSLDGYLTYGKSWYDNESSDGWAVLVKDSIDHIRETNLQHIIAIKVQTGDVPVVI